MQGFENRSLGTDDHKPRLGRNDGLWAWQVQSVGQVASNLGGCQEAGAQAVADSILVQRAAYEIGTTQDATKLRGLYSYK